MCFASARTLSESAKRLSHISLSHPRQPYTSSWKQILSQSSNLVHHSVLLDIMGNRSPGHKTSPSPRKNCSSFLSSSSQDTPRATHQPSTYNNPAPRQLTTSDSQLTHQHSSDHGAQPLPQTARALQRVHLPRRVHLEEPIRADSARRPLGKVSSMLLSPLIHS